MKKIILNNDAFVIENFLSSDECNDYIILSENQGFEEAKVNIDGKQTMFKGIRNNERLLFKDEQLAQKLWLKLQPFCDTKIGLASALGLNEMFRFYKYTENQRFKKHRDGRFERNETEFSIFTFLIYLNEDFEGGETWFNDFEVKPKTGSALIFNHKLMHEGKLIISGTKYVLRSDIMYRF